MSGKSRQVSMVIAGASIAVAIALCFTGGARSAESVTPATQVLQLPGGEAGIGFDDLQYAPLLKKILVPGGRSGRLFLISTSSRQISFIGGFTSKATYAGGHGDGTTSACEREGLIYATDRGSRSVKIVDPSAGKIIGSVRLSNSPDYVRCRPDVPEIWVTEPSKELIEILALSADGRSAKIAGSIMIQGGPESLTLDPQRGRAYTHTWKGTTCVVNLKARAVIGSWSNGCEGSRGGALDGEQGLLFIGCGEGKAVVIDVTTGKVVSSLKAGSDVDSVAFAAEMNHLYVPGAGSADLSILGVSGGGQLSLLDQMKTGPGAHTAAFDPEGHAVYIGLPEHGQVLILEDTFPPSSR